MSSSAGPPLVQICLASSAGKGKWRDDQDEEDSSRVQVVTPGEPIARDGGFLRGHGTYIANDDAQALHASVAGLVRRVNKLVSVQPVRRKYQGEVGDVLVGRVTEVQQRRWKVDTNMRLDSVLLLSSVNLPGGELRRRSAEDELGMRGYLQEGDLVSAEVQQIYSDGKADSDQHCISRPYIPSLRRRVLTHEVIEIWQTHAGSPRPSALRPHQVIAPYWHHVEYLIGALFLYLRRRKSHFHRLPCGIGVILGNNGYVWISPNVGAISATTDGEDAPPAQEQDGEDFSGASDVSRVDRRDREAMARLRNCILALSGHGVMLWDTTLNHAYDASAKYAVPGELLLPAAMEDVAMLTRQRLSMEMDTQ